MKILAIISFFSSISFISNEDLEEVSYSQFRQEIFSNQIAEITYRGDLITILVIRKDGSKYTTNRPIYKSDPVLDSALQENGVITSYEEVQQPSIWSQLFIGALPLILFPIFSFFGIILR